MKILLLNIDSTYPNLALHKIAKYHTDLGDEVIWDIPLIRVGKIYASCIFSWNKSKCKELPKDTTIGGSGWDLSASLPDEIEKIRPHINLGFTTRGCIRNCPFCIVPKKEGKIRVVGDLLDLWDGKSKFLTLLDNNILAAPKEHFEKICNQAVEKKLTLDFNQGLDCRLLNEDNCGLLSQISHKEYKFAFDSMAVQPYVENAIKLLRKNNIKRCTWYVLVGFDTTEEEDLYRLNFLRDNGQNAFVQRYNKKMSRFYNEIASWAAQHNIFHTFTWQEYCKVRKNGCSAETRAVSYV